MGILLKKKTKKKHMGVCQQTLSKWCWCMCLSQPRPRPNFSRTQCNELNTQVPSFIGNDYYCETGNDIESTFTFDVLYTNDPLQVLYFHCSCANFLLLYFEQISTVTCYLLTIITMPCLDIIHIDTRFQSSTGNNSDQASQRLYSTGLVDQLACSCSAVVICYYYWLVVVVQ